MKRILFQEIMLDMLYFLILFGLFAFPFAIMFGNLQAIMYLWLFAIPFFINFILRRQISSIPIMIAAHMIIPIAVLFFMPAGLIRWVTFIIVALLVVFSLTQRAHCKRKFEVEIKGAAIIAMIFLYLLSTHQGFYYMTFIYPILILLIMIGGTMHTRMVRMDYSLETAANFSAQPVKQIRAFDRKATWAVIALLLIFTAFFRYVLVDNVLRVLVAFINSLFSTNLEPTPMDMEPNLPPPMSGGLNLGFIAGAGDPHPIWEYIWNIVGVVVTLLAIVTVVVVIVIAVVLIYRKMEYKAPSVAPGEDEREFIPPTWISRTRKRRPSSQSDNELRRLFYKKIRQHMKKGTLIEKSDTPLQMAERIKAEDIHLLAEEYSKARYYSSKS